MSITYEHASRPADGSTMTILDGLEWLRMPLPFSLNHINLWLLADGDKWAIVDCGVGTDQTREAWHMVFAGAMGGAAASRVIATHMHPDHIGCAGFLTQHFDVELWMTRDEYMLCRILVADTGREAPGEALQFYSDAGFSEQHLQDYRAAFGFFGKFVTPLPEAYRRISDGDNIAIGEHSWTVITGGGHSPEHACLYDTDRNVMIAGDQLLPTISSNVSVWPTEPEANPLHDWFDSLHGLRRRIPEDVLVLPAHGKPFRGAYTRIDALIKEHEDRLATLRDTCKEPQRAIDVFPAMFRAPIDKSNRMMATGEALSHLNYLVCAGELAVEHRNGCNWYQTC